MYVGTITRLMLDRGFGFISSPRQPDVFFHCRDLAEDLPFDETLQERRVKFDVLTTSRGPRAQDVRPAK
jgi:cold shock CspA family protein